MRGALDARRDGTAVTVSLRALQLGEHLPAATGALRANADGTAPAVELQVPALDLVRLRAATLALAGDLDAVRNSRRVCPPRGRRSRSGSTPLEAISPPSRRSDRCAPRHGSRRPLSTFPHSESPSHTALAALVLADGTLRGRELSGTIGRSSFKAGTLAIDLAPVPALRALEAAVDADLAETLALARRALGKSEPPALADVESLQGRATGTVAYEAHRRGPRVVAEVAALQATGRYRTVPFPVSHKWRPRPVRARPLGRRAGCAAVSGARASRPAHWILRSPPRRPCAPRVRRQWWYSTRSPLGLPHSRGCGAPRASPERDRIYGGAPPPAIWPGQCARGARVRGRDPAAPGAARRASAARAGHAHGRRAAHHAALDRARSARRVDARCARGRDGNRARVRIGRAARGPRPRRRNGRRAGSRLGALPLAVAGDGDAAGAPHARLGQACTVRAERARRSPRTVRSASSAARAPSSTSRGNRVISISAAWP